MTLKAFETQGADAARQLAGRAASLMALISFPAAAGLALVAEPLTTIIVGESVRSQAAVILPWIALSGLLNGMMTYYFHEAFTIRRRTGFMAGLMAGAAMLNLALNLVFIPAFGIVGAAYATVLAYLISLVICAIAGRKLFPLPLPWGDWVKAATATMIMASGVFIVPDFETAWIALAGKALVGAIVYTAAAYVFNIADCRNWLSDFNKLNLRTETQS